MSSTAAPAAEPATFCRLCGQKARAHFAHGTDSFCCTGCREVFRILLESRQLEAGDDPKSTPLYQQCLQMGLIAIPSESEAADDSDILMPESLPKVYLPAASDSIETVREAAFRIGGMWCTSCAWLIEHAIKKRRGVEGCRVFFASDTVRIAYKPARIGPDDLEAAIRGLGYSAEVYNSESIDPKSSIARARRMAFIRAVVALIFAMNAMMFNIALYVGAAAVVTSNANILIPRLVFALSLPVFWAGYPIFQKAFQAARHGVATMETLITLGAITAFAYSVWAMVQGGAGNRYYFDTADMLIALVLVGKHIESGARSQSTDAVALLYGLMPRKALRRANEGPDQLVPVESLVLGDLIVVRPGERIPSDGRVLSGSAHVDESVISGESRPVVKEAGSDVTGGTLATDAPLVIEVTRLGKDSTLAQMIDLVEEAMAAKSPTERWADQISRVFVPVIIVIAVATGLGVHFGLHQTVESAVRRMVSVLVIACPCALGLATPLAITLCIGEAARRGILIVNARVFEIIPKVKQLFLDKTGTLTEGRFSVLEIVAPGRDAVKDLEKIAALEYGSEHPLARAIVDKGMCDPEAQPALIALQQAEGTALMRVEGAGVTGTVAGENWFVGNRALAEASGSGVDSQLERISAEAGAKGHTTLFYGEGGKTVGAVVLGDSIRPGAAAAIDRLKAMGLIVTVISGDSEATTQAVSKSAGIDMAIAGMRPAEKVRAIEEAGQGPSGSVVVGMVGDGINDAPALAKADVGIAFGSGAEIARRAADVTVVGDDLNRIPDLFQLARFTTGVIRQNLFWACIYNLVCIPLAVAGYVIPIVAAFAMLASSLSVIYNTKRLKVSLAARTAKLTSASAV